ncbi:MAG: arsenosugar biosynthesis radical SAM protein ArsS [Gammaproteobacteria bacterium]|nr:MAG: arsenosugar biosynthesis radical SAM protein ArsS [Gammaproteobacteria bacterium]
MRDPLPLLVNTDFPPLRRGRLDTLQVNVGYRCNQSCVHCHVNAGPKRTEDMQADVAELIVRYLDVSNISTLDITGGAPELNAQFRYLVREARDKGLRVIDRCNLTILEQPGQEDLGEFLAGQGVDVVASMPCYLEENVNAQRGKGVFAASIRGLRRLNALGFGMPDSNLSLDLVYNPQGPALPPSQQVLEPDYRKILRGRYGISFNQLYVFANMPVGRFGSTLISKGELDGYLALLRDAHRDDNLDSVMCRSLLSIDWQGYVYDCDFNQMLGLPMRVNGSSRVHLSQVMDVDVEGRAIAVRAHCYACTAGQGSSCGGALS